MCPGALCTMLSCTMQCGSCMQLKCCILSESTIFQILTNNERNSFSYEVYECEFCTVLVPENWMILSYRKKDEELHRPISKFSFKSTRLPCTYRHLSNFFHLSFALIGEIAKNIRSLVALLFFFFPPFFLFKLSWFQFALFIFISSGPYIIHILILGFCVRFCFSLL